MTSRLGWRMYRSCQKMPSQDIGLSCLDCAFACRLPLICLPQFFLWCFGVTVSLEANKATYCEIQFVRVFVSVRLQNLIYVQFLCWSGRFPLFYQIPISRNVITGWNIHAAALIVPAKVAGLGMGVSNTYLKPLWLGAGPCAGFGVGGLKIPL